MSDLTSVGIIVLAMLIQALLQLTPGVFSIWCHYALAKNSKNKVLDLSGYFAVGIEMVASLMLMVTYFIFINMPNDEMINWVLAGILVALGLFVFAWYFRKGAGTELFISRKSAKGFYEKARTARKKSDIFVLGIVAYVSELFLILPLMIVIILQMRNFEVGYQVAILAAYVMAAMTSFGTIRGRFLRGKNLAEIQRTRTKSKNFYRFLISSSYMVVAALLVISRFC